MHNRRWHRYALAAILGPLGGLAVAYANPVPRIEHGVETRTQLAERLTTQLVRKAEAVTVALKPRVP